MVYTPNILQDDMGNPPSFYYIVTRRKQQPFLIQKLPEVSSTMGFGMQRTPAYQFIARLRDYKPHLKDVLIVSSTASADVGLIVRSDQPLASDEESKALAGQFTVAEVSDDTKRASAPLTESAEETSVIGLAPDLSSSETVLTPIPGEDITETSTPLPGLFHLNNDGVLSSWWFIYSDAIRQNVPYSGLVSAGEAAPNQAQTQPAAPVTAPVQQQPAFGQPSFGSPSPFGASAFGKPSGGATFGSPSSMGASTMGATAFGKPSFGSPSAMGGGSAPAFGKPSAPGPSFGTPSQPGASFGSPSTVGQPQFGQSGFGKATAAFGQPSTPGKSLLGSGPSASGGGFSSFSGAGGGGFGGLAAAKPGESPFAKAPAGESPFGKAPAGGSPFAQTTTTQSAFSKTSTSSPFGAKPPTETAFPSKPAEVKNPFGAPSGGFVLGSSFKGDGSAVNDLQKSDKPSTDTFSFGGSFDEMVSTPSKPSPPAESMDDMEDAGAIDQPAKTEPSSLFGASKPTAPFGQTTEPAQPSGETTKSGFSFGGESNKSGLSLFGNTATTATAQTTSQNQVTSPVSVPSDKTATPKREQFASTPPFSSLEAPLPPDPTTKASYAPGDTSASSNVSKSSVEEAPLPPDFLADKKPTPRAEDAPLPPDFVSQKKPSPKEEEAPLPPDFLAKPKKAESPPPVPEEAPLPPDFTASKTTAPPAEEAVPVPDGSDADSEQDADESDFSDSGEEITHDDTEVPSPKPSIQSSFSKLSEKSSTGGLFGGVSKPKQDQQAPRPLFGEIPKQPLLPPAPSAQGNREPHRSPSPTRISSQKNILSRKTETRQPAGSALSSRKASLTQMAQRGGLFRKPSHDAREEEIRAQQEAQRAEEEVLSLSEDDEDERLRADLARPVEPVSTLDPFLPHQNYMGETAKPGIPGMIERLYRDINSMIDTLGINARSLESFLLYQQPSQDSDADEWVYILKGDQPTDILDQKVFLRDISKLDDTVDALHQYLQEQRVQGVEEKLEQCRQLLTKDIVTLRGQFSSIRKTLDAHTDSGAILTAPLSAEQAALQHDLRSAFTEVQAKLADLEQGVSLLRAKIADMPHPDGVAKTSRKRPTVEAVSSTIATMMSMAESKSSDIDVLEAHMRKLGVDISSPAPGSREASPYSTPRKNVGRLPATPGSRGSIDGSAYHTPESATRGANFRASINGSAKHSRLRSVELVGPVIAQEESSRWKNKTSRRQHLVCNLKKAIEKKETKVRSVDEW